MFKHIVLFAQIESLRKHASGGEVGAPRNPMANAIRVSVYVAPRVRIRVACDITQQSSQEHEIPELQYRIMR